MNKFGVFASIALLLSFQQVYAQTEVSGNITDAETGEALIGVSVLAQGTTIGTVTSVRGNYSITVPADVSNLIIYYSGYESKTISVDLQTVVDVAMEARLLLDEIVLPDFGNLPKVTQVDDILNANSITDGRKLAVAIPWYIFRLAVEADPVAFNAAPNIQAITLEITEYIASTWPSGSAAAFNLETGELLLRLGLNGEIVNLGEADQVFRDINLPFDQISTGDLLGCVDWPDLTLNLPSTNLNTSFDNRTARPVPQVFLESLTWTGFTPTEKSFDQQILVDLGSFLRTIEVNETLPLFVDTQGRVFQTGRSTTLNIWDAEELVYQATEQVTFDNFALVQLGPQACPGEFSFVSGRVASIVRDTTVPPEGITTEERTVRSQLTFVSGVAVPVFINDGFVDTIEIVEVTMNGIIITNIAADTGVRVRREDISWKFSDPSNDDFFDPDADFEKEFSNYASREFSSYLTVIEDTSP